MSFINLNVFLILPFLSGESVEPPQAGVCEDHPGSRRIRTRNLLPFLWHFLFHCKLNIQVCSSVVMMKFSVMRNPDVMHRWEMTRPSNNGTWSRQDMA